MTFPILIALIAGVLLLAYFARKQITWTMQKGTGGSLGMALVVVIIGVILGWSLDAYLGWSIIPSYMYAVGGALQALAILFWAFFALLILSMVMSAKKCGQLVA